MPRTSIFTPCAALREVGIGSPESRDGKQFCASECPYERCIMVESESRHSQAYKGVEEAKRLLSEGNSIKEIAGIMGKDRRTVERYLGGK